MRISELAKELQVSNTDILINLKAQGIEKKHSSNLTEEEEYNLRHVFIEPQEVLSFQDIRTNTPKVMDYLDKTFFTNSTITMMGDDYIKSSVSDRLGQFVLINENIVTLDTNSEDLSRAMLRASLSQEDINFILNTSLKISDVKLEYKEKSENGEETPENVNKMVEEKTKMMGSIDNLISIIRDSLGTSRIVAEASEEAIMQALGAGLEPEKAVKNMLTIERPLEFNLDYLDLTKISNSQIFEFLSSMMAVDSNSTLKVSFPLDALVPDIKTFFQVDLPAIGDAAVAFARASSKNSFSFKKEEDAFKSLWATL